MSLMSCRRSRDCSVSSLGGEENDVIRSILRGAIPLEELPTAAERTVRVFLSSTFSDMAPERNALMQSVYPQLKEFCRQQYRLEFQTMDLRWGIREQSHNDHTIVEFCLREIDKCRAKSIGPNFVALIGQKYGYRPFPSTIDASEFQAIRSELSTAGEHSSVALLDEWFKKDTNVIPNIYTLQPISSILPDFTDTVDSGRKQRASDEWQRIHDSLRQSLRQGVTSCIRKERLPPECKNRYFISVTECEIERGILSLSSTECNSSSLCFMRNISNLQTSLTHNRTHQYIDIVPDFSRSLPLTPEIDSDAQSLLDDLRNKLSGSITDERNIEYFEFDWKVDKHKSPSDDSEYLREV